MKITEVLVESQQLDEGPFGQAVGKFAGGVAKGVGAVAGGVAGMGRAFKKGYQSGKATVAGDPDPNAEAPASDEVGGPETQPSAGDINKAGPAGTANAKPLQGAAKVAADKTAAATAGQDQDAAGQTMYSQVKANIDKLDKKGKQRILQLLQKSMTAPAPGPTPAPAPAPTAGATTKDKAGAGAMGAMANQLGAAGAPKPANTMANAPVSKTNTAKPGNPNAAAPIGGTTKDKAAAATAKPAAGAPDELGRVEPTMEPEVPAAAPAKAGSFNNQLAGGKQTTTAGGKFNPATMKNEPGAAAPTGAPTPQKATTAPAKVAPAADPNAPIGTQQVGVNTANGGRQLGTKRADDGDNFDTDTGKALSGRALNGVRRKAEVGAGALGAVRKKMAAKAPSQATVDADRERTMGPTSDSIIRKQPSLAEGFSLFRKRA